MYLDLWLQHATRHSQVSRPAEDLSTGEWRRSQRHHHAVWQLLVQAGHQPGPKRHQVCYTFCPHIILKAAYKISKWNLFKSRVSCKHHLKFLLIVFISRIFLIFLYRLFFSKSTFCNENAFLHWKIKNELESNTDDSFYFLFCRAFKQLNVKHEPLTLITPQFETPLPPLQPAVFPPQFRELEPPKLDLFDLDEQFSSEKVRIAQQTNKCK